MHDEIIHNIEHIDIASNELMTRKSLNRNFAKLLENDKELLSYSTSVYNGLYRVMPYVYGKAYGRNDLVWFIDFRIKPSDQKAYDEFLQENIDKIDELSAAGEFDKFYTITAYLLRSLSNGNMNVPKMEIVDMIPVFDASGWHNENPFGAIYTDYLSEFTAQKLKEQLYKIHETVSQYHKFGELSSYKDLDVKVLKADVSNIDPNREKNLFPNYTKEIEPKGIILGGSMRYWDCGLVEYDIEFKLGDTSKTYAAYNADGSLKMYDDIDANYLNLDSSSKNYSELLSSDNSKYFLTKDDAKIFCVEGNLETTVNGITQHNLNETINVFSGTIEFPVSFKDTSYMVFMSGTNCISEAESDDLIQNVNSITYTNKSRKSIMAVMIVPTYGGTKPNVLYYNRFRCQIIGRWK